MATPDCIDSIFDLFLTVPFKTAPDFNIASCAALWEPLFSDVSDKDLGVAAFAYMQATPSGFWPTPGAIRQHLPQSVSVLPEWSEAFARIGDVARTRGSGQYDRKRAGISAESDFKGFFQSPEADKATRAGIDAIGGWRTYCMSKEGDQTVRAAFRDAYRAALTIEKRRGDDRAVRALLEQAGAGGGLEGSGLRLIMGGRS